MKFIFRIVKNPFFGPIIFFLIYFITPLLIINIFKISSFSKETSYIVIFVILILISEIIFSYAYKKLNSEAYKKKEKIPFKSFAVESHPNLPYIHKKKFNSAVKPTKLNYPLHNEVYSAPELKTNNLGHVNGIDGGRDVLIPKPKNIFRINCLGASTTQNYLQDDSSVYSYPLELEKILKTKNKVNLEVNNCGSGGYASSDILVRFLLQNIDTNPDVIVLYHAYNDIRSYLTSNFQSDYSHSRKNLGENYFKFYLGSFLPYIPLNFVNYLQNKWYPQNHRYTLIESISRGAEKVTFIEKDYNASNILKNNLIKLSVIKKSKIFNDKIENVLINEIKEKFHIIFLDPPYADNSFCNNLKLIKKNKIFKTKHIVIIHREKKTDDNFNDLLNVIETKIYGRSKIIFGVFN